MKTKIKSMNVKKNEYEISEGNLKVLETIPKMMKEEFWRNQLRKMVLDYIIKGDIIRNINKRI